MDTLLSMKVFCQVVHSGSFTRAAGSTARVQGRLRVSIPVWFANPVFAA